MGLRHGSANRRRGSAQEHVCPATRNTRLERRFVLLHLRHNDRERVASLCRSMSAAFPCTSTSSRRLRTQFTTPATTPFRLCRMFSTPCGKEMQRVNEHCAARGCCPRPQGDSRRTRRATRHVASPTHGRIVRSRGASSRRRHRGGFSAESFRRR